MHTLFLAQAQRFRRPLLFCMVGISGILINSAALWALARSGDLPVPLASLLATELAILSNFILNDRWTFDTNESSWLARLVRFNSVALGGMVLTALMLTLLMQQAHMELVPANILAIGVATVWNYMANSRWTWAAAPAQQALAHPADPGPGINWSAPLHGWELLPDRDEEVDL